jgi:hypothetical protein
MCWSFCLTNEKQRQGRLVFMEGMRAAHDLRAVAMTYGYSHPNLTKTANRDAALPAPQQPSNKLQPASFSRNPGLAANFASRCNLLSKSNGVRHTQDEPTCARDEALGSRNWLSRSEDSALSHS